MFRATLLGEAVHDLDAGEIALVHRAVEGLPGEGLLMNAAVGLRSKKHPSSSRARGFSRWREPPASRRAPGRAATCRLDRVHEMPLDRILCRERDVVAALHHARAAALAEQALTATVIDSAGFALCACSAAKSPAPPARGSGFRVEASAPEPLCSDDDGDEGKADGVEERLRVDEKEAGDDKQRSLPQRAAFPSQPWRPPRWRQRRPRR